MHWNLKQRKYTALEKKDGKAFRGQWAYSMFFFGGLLLWGKRAKQKQGRGKMIQAAVGKT